MSLGYSLLCPEDSGHGINGLCRIVYALNKQNVLSDVVDENTPHSHICKEHILRVPIEEFRETPFGIKGMVYAVSRIKGFGMQTSEGIVDSHRIISRYLSHESMQKYLPRTLDFIKRDEVEKIVQSLRGTEDGCE